MPKHQAGKKLSSKHTTVTDAAEIVVLAMRKSTEFPTVKKISLGVVKSASGGEFRVKTQILSDGVVKVTVRGNTSVQVLHVYCENSSQVVSKLLELFPNK